MRSPCLTIKSALVLRGGALGDFILTLPIIRALEREFSTVSVMANREFVALGADARFALDDVDFAPFFTATPELPSRWRDYLREQDLVISYLHDPDGFFERNVRSCGVKKFVAAPYRIKSGSHATTQLARPLERLGISISDFGPRIVLDDSERTEVAHPLIALHPGSGSPRKNWPIENWITLIDELLSVAAVADRGCSTGSLVNPMPRPATAATTSQRIILVGGEADAEEISRIRERFTDRIDYAIDWPLRRLAALLANANFIGHDSGISHLAAAVGARCVILFGPTDPKVWAPRNKNARVLVASNNDLRQLSLQEVRDALELSRA